MSKQQQPRATEPAYSRIAEFWKQFRRFLLASGISMSVIGAILYASFWNVASHTAQLVPAQTTQLATPTEYELGSRLQHESQQSAGSSAYVVEIIDGELITLAYPKTVTTPAHYDIGLLAEATCELEATDAPGASVFVLAFQQGFILNFGTGQVSLIDDASAYVHTNYLWDMIQPPTISLAPIGMSNDGLSIEKVVIILTGLVTRSTPYGVPSESYDITLTLTIVGNGEVSCRFYAPPTLVRVPTVALKPQLTLPVPGAVVRGRMRSPDTVEGPESH
jgi:hypothetical protein